MKEGSLTKEFVVSGPLRVEILGGASAVILRAHEEGKARVEMAYRAHGLGRSAQELGQAFLENPPVIFSQNVLRVGPAPEGIDLDCTLFLPPEAEVEVEVGSGDVSAQGLKERLRVRSGAGDIELQDIAGEIILRSGSGDIQLKQVFGAISVRTGSGDIHGEEVKGDVDLETGSGDINLKGIEGELRLFTGSGDIKIEGELSEGSWRIQTGSGDVCLVLPGEVEAELTLQTDFGDISCDFPVTAKEAKEGRLTGQLGKTPKARIFVKTDTGDITICGR